MTTGRHLHEQQTHYIRARVRFNTPGIATGIPIGKLPIGALIKSVTVCVETVFNAATTNVLTVGLSDESTTFDDLVNAAAVNEGATGVTVVNNATRLVTTSFLDVIAQFTQSGTAATTGAATIVVEYFADNDIGTL
jgi:hypothetical protein